MAPFGGCKSLIGAKYRFVNDPPAGRRVVEFNLSADISLGGQLGVRRRFAASTLTAITLCSRGGRVSLIAEDLKCVCERLEAGGVQTLDFKAFQCPH
jgi:hypothetical protein